MTTADAAAAIRIPKDERFLALDGLRGLAILAVLLHHLFVSTPTGPVGNRVAVLVEFASHGVDLFFALSGFLIARQLAKGRLDPGFSARFWTRRIAKIFPLYFLVVLTVFVFLRPLLEITQHLRELRWLGANEHKWPWYACFLSNIRNTLDGRFTNPALDVAWSLAIEVQFYIAVFFFSILVSPKKWPSAAFAAICFAIIFRTAALFFGSDWILILTMTPGRLDAFSFGILAAIAPNCLRRCPTAVVWVVLALPLVLAWSRASTFVETVGYSLVALAAGIVIDRATREEMPSWSSGFLTQKWLTFLGRISYSIYLIHLPLRAVLRDYTVPKDLKLSSPSAWVTQVGFTLGCGLACVVAGWLTWRLVEEPTRLAILSAVEKRGSD